ncbi:amidohydrolase [Portibacter lacus]|uniref:Amidohydrolase n=1 Tax=Portibacter lacus TaxID=1099794 RepID=A0AA37WG00_9BACT|nr:amidohydrolase [Portibacter lacus]GLR19302.1 amidohydrolase [Portibacter lacus]
MKKLTLFILLILANSCAESEKKTNSNPDLIITNAKIWTVDKSNPESEAIAVKDGRIVALASTIEILKLKGPETDEIDAKGNFLMPGFIEGHGHFSGLGSSLQNLNFLKSTSWDEIVQMVGEKAKTLEKGEWVEGRGWHQEKWTTKEDNLVDGYPNHQKLSEVSPDNPVVLVHASGHGLFANKKAMEMAGISKETTDPSGGRIVRDKEGNAIGMFEERAAGAIGKIYREYLATLDKDKQIQKWREGIELAEEECLRNGITSFQDAGSSFEEIAAYTKMAETGELDIRLWAMLRHSSEEMKGKAQKARVINAGNNFFTCRAIKTEVDGALGSYGAWLIDPYHDKPDFHGQNTTEISEVQNIADIAVESNMQLCVHAIGDRANKVVLDIIEAEEKEKPELKDARWRIEHAQHVDPADIPRFKELGVIAAMQGIHCTSDALFAENRLGEKRAREGAYAWRSFLDAGVVIANGTDAPVEDVNPLESFYASVTRKRIDNGFEFFVEQAMTREEAVYSYTLGNAYAGSEEDFKGSLEIGKVADIVILSEDLINCSDDAILDTEVLWTIVNGKVKFNKS